MDNINIAEIDKFPYKITLLVSVKKSKNGVGLCDIEKLNEISTWMNSILVNERNNETNYRYIEFKPEGTLLRCGFLDQASMALIALTWSEYVVV